MNSMTVSSGRDASDADAAVGDGAATDPGTVDGVGDDEPPSPLEEA